MQVLLTVTESQDLSNAPNVSQQNKIKTEEMSELSNFQCDYTE